MAEDAAAPPSPSRRRRTTWLLVASLAVVALAVAAFQLAPRTERAPDFHLTSTGYEGGAQGAPAAFNLTDLRGRVVVLDLMAVACTSCRVLTQDTLLPVHAAFANRSVTFLSVDVWADPATGSSAGETQDELVALQKREGVPWRHALDTDQVYRKYSAIELPRLVVVGPDGGVLLAASGLTGARTLTSAIEGGLAGTASPVGLPQLGLGSLAVAAGLASFLAPCSLGLLPAYLGLLLRGSGRPRTRTPAILGGLLAALGMVVAYAVLAVLLLAANASGFGPPLRAALPRVEFAMGVLLAALGALMLAKLDWSRVAARLGAGKVDGRKGFLLFGVGYALGAFACTGPVFLPVLVAGLGAGAAGVLLAFGAYTLALAAFLVAAAALVAKGQAAAVHWLVRHAGAVSRLTALLVLGGGLYLAWFAARAL
jgi:cytochrome c-type biogenesis protein